MREKTLFKIIGVAIFLIGKVILLTTIFKMNGFAISTDIESSDSLVGVFLIIIGIVVFVSGVERK